MIAKAIRLPSKFYAAALSLATLDPFLNNGVSAQGQIPNSIDNLEPGSLFLRSLRQRPFAEGVALHSIVALGEKKMRGPLVERNDGLVSYKSAHLEEAQSEKRVFSGHRAPNHPEAIEEVVRILRLHLGD